MKNFLSLKPAWLAGLVLLLAGMLPSAIFAADDRFPPQLLAFSAAKEQQASALATNLSLKIAPEIWLYFRAARSGDWAAMNNLCTTLKSRLADYSGATNDPTVDTLVWQTVIDVQTAYESFAVGGTKYPAAFGRGIITSIPAGSIYFGGTDAGRGLVSGLCRSQIEGQPFFTIAQNTLSGDQYLQYLRYTYGDKIALPTTNDLAAALQAYTMDVQRRWQHDQQAPKDQPQLRPGENVQAGPDGRLGINGQVAMVQVNGLLAKVIWGRNPGRDFYVQESVPMEWMYPLLEPHGLIMKLNHQPVESLTAQTLNADHAFWSQQCDAMLGGWLRQETTISNICNFVDITYRVKDLSRFGGDREFVTNEFATRVYSKLRLSIAGLYAWRLINNAATDKNQLEAEADFAFRQAFALCPRSQETLYRYVNFLLAQGRFDEAILLANEAHQLMPGDQRIDSLLASLQLFHRQANDMAHPGN